MKIIAGKYKGRKLNSVDQQTTRPTLGRIKEDIFNILFNYFDLKDKIIVDLFAGSGAMGIEALSRGANCVFFNDRSKKATQVIKKNLEMLNCTNFYLTNLDYLQCLNQFKSKQINLFFLDPPYNKSEILFNCLQIIYQQNLLANNGIIICETDYKITYNNFKNLVLLKEKHYKNKTNIFFLKNIKE